MMMRPRRYGTLNRAVARSITYALRDANRNKYNKGYSKAKCLYANKINNSNTSSDGDVAVAFIFIVAVVFVLAIISH